MQKAIAHTFLKYMYLQFLHNKISYCTSFTKPEAFRPVLPKPIWTKKLSLQILKYKCMKKEKLFKSYIVENQAPDTAVTHQKQTLTT